MIWPQWCLFPLFLKTGPLLLWSISCCWTHNFLWNLFVAAAAVSAGLEKNKTLIYIGHQGLIKLSLRSSVIHFEEHKKCCLRTQGMTSMAARQCHKYICSMGGLLITFLNHVASSTSTYCSHYFIFQRDASTKKINDRTLKHSWEVHWKNSTLRNKW